MADSGPDGHTSPWGSYSVLVSLYASMQAFDVYLLKHFLIPTWLFRWKTAQTAIVALSLVSGIWKGRFLEQNTDFYMEKALHEMGDPLEGMREAE